MWIYFKAQINEMELQAQLDNEISQIYDSIKVKDIILDCSCINLLDTMGVEALVKVGMIFLKLLNINTYSSTSFLAQLNLRPDRRCDSSDSLQK